MGYNITINDSFLHGLQVGREDYQKISLETRRRLASICEKTLQSANLPSGQPIRFSMEMGVDGLFYLYVNKTWLKMEGMRDVVHALHQEASRRQLGQILSAGPKRDEKGERAVAQQGRLDVAMETGDVVQDGLAVVRNIVTAASPDPKAMIVLRDVAVPVMKVVGALGVTSGVLGAVGSAVAVGQEGNALHTAYTHKNREGGAFALAGLIVALDSMASSSLSIAQNAAKLSHAAHAAAAAASAIPFVGFAVYTVGYVLQVVKLTVVMFFREEMHDILRNESKNGLYEALSWIRQQVVLGSFEDPDVLQKKLDQFEARTSSDVRKLVQDKATPELLEKLKIGDLEAIEETKKIINAVDKASVQRLAMSVFKIALLCIGIVALTFALVCTGPAAPILFAVAALLSIPVDLKWLQRRLDNKIWDVYNRITGPKWYNSINGEICETSRVMLPPDSATQSAPLIF